MNTAVKTIIAVVVALAVFFGLQEFRKRRAHAPPPEAQMAAELDKLRADAAAARKEGVSESEALRSTAADQAAQQLQGQSADDRRRTAANMFFGFYYLNTRVRVEYCRERGVDLGPFVRAFDAEHGAEHAAAKAIFAEAGADPEALVPVLLSQFRPVVEQDMKDVTASAQAPLEQACALFNDNAQILAKAIAMPATVTQALMEAQ